MSVGTYAKQDFCSRSPLPAAADARLHSDTRLGLVMDSAGVLDMCTLPATPTRHQVPLGMHDTRYALTSAHVQPRAARAQRRPTGRSIKKPTSLQNHAAGRSSGGYGGAAAVFRGDNLSQHAHSVVLNRTLVNKHARRMPGASVPVPLRLCRHPPPWATTSMMGRHRSSLMRCGMHASATWARTLKPPPRMQHVQGSWILEGCPLRTSNTYPTRTSATIAT